MPRTLLSWKWWAVGGLLAAVAAGGYYLAPLASPAAVSAYEPEAPQSHAESACVEVVYPDQGGVERSTSQSGTVQAFERARLYAAVSDYLKTALRWRSGGIAPMGPNDTINTLACEAAEGQGRDTL